MNTHTGTKVYTMAHRSLWAQGNKRMRTQIHLNGKSRVIGLRGKPPTSVAQDLRVQGSMQYSLKVISVTGGREHGGHGYSCLKTVWQRRGLSQTACSGNLQASECVVGLICSAGNPWAPLPRPVGPLESPATGGNFPLHIEKYIEVNIVLIHIVFSWWR